jgi:hypothetical protein
MEPLTTRCSTILIATGDSLKVYQSLEEVPARLRERLVATTRGGNCATILIADQKGREEIRKAVQQSGADDHARLTQALLSGGARPRLSTSRWAVWPPYIERFLLVGSLAYLAWALISLR